MPPAEAGRITSETPARVTGLVVSRSAKKTYDLIDPLTTQEAPEYPASSESVSSAGDTASVAQEEKIGMGGTASLGVSVEDTSLALAAPASSPQSPLEGELELAAPWGMPWSRNASPAAEVMRACHFAAGIEGKKLSSQDDECAEASLARTRSNHEMDTDEESGEDEEVAEAEARRAQACAAKVAHQQSLTMLAHPVLALPAAAIGSSPAGASSAATHSLHPHHGCLHDHEGGQQCNGSKPIFVTPAPGVLQKGKGPGKTGKRKKKGGGRVGSLSLQGGAPRPAMTQAQMDLKALEDLSEDLCRLCGDGGHLLLCESCPAAFHLECMGMDKVPEEDWFCPGCRCELCGLSDFSPEFAPRMMLLCDQCEREYHVDCLQRFRTLTLDAVPQGKWFCSPTCIGIHEALTALCASGRHAVESGFSWQLLRASPHKAAQAALARALSVLQECFNPVVEPQSGKDLVPMMVFNQSVESADCSGFYTVVLRHHREVMCAATFRVFGKEAAELPLIGTRFVHRRKGLCRRVVRVVEELLLSLGVKRLALPAVPTVQDTWAQAFGFHVCNPRELLELSALSILLFPGTTLMMKELTPETLSSFTCLEAPPEPPMSLDRITPAVKKDKKRPGSCPQLMGRCDKRMNAGPAPRKLDLRAEETTTVVAGETRSSRTVKVNSAVLAAIRSLAPKDKSRHFDSAQAHKPKRQCEREPRDERRYKTGRMSLNSTPAELAEQASALRLAAARAALTMVRKQATAAEKALEAARALARARGLVDQWRALAELANSPHQDGCVSVDSDNSNGGGDVQGGGFGVERGDVAERGVRAAGTRDARDVELRDQGNLWDAACAQSQASEVTCSMECVGDTIIIRLSAIVNKASVCEGSEFQRWPNSTGKHTDTRCGSASPTATGTVDHWESASREGDGIVVRSHGVPPSHSSKHFRVEPRTPETEEMTRCEADGNSSGGEEVKPTSRMDATSVVVSVGS